MRLCTPRAGALIFAVMMMLYSLVHICMFVSAFIEENAEPDWIVLFKLLCDFILLPSSILLVIAIIKDNLTIVLISEVMYFCTSIGFVLYAIIFVILFIKRQEFGIPFFSFMAQRIFFFGLSTLALICTDIYRKDRRVLMDNNNWTDVSSLTRTSARSRNTQRSGNTQIQSSLAKSSISKRLVGITPGTKPPIPFVRKRVKHFRYSYTTGPPRFIQSKCAPVKMVPTRYAISFYPGRGGCSAPREPTSFSPYFQKEYVYKRNPPYSLV